MPKCKYQASNIGCDGKTSCAVCGWNPAVNAARCERLRRQANCGVPIHAPVVVQGTDCALGLPISCRDCNALACSSRTTLEATA